VLKYASYKAIKKYGARWLPANKSDNLKEIHEGRTEQLPTIEYILPKGKPKHKLRAGDKINIAITSISFANWVKTPQKHQQETPYTISGREMYMKRTGKQRPLSRADYIFNDSISILVALNKKRAIYNFEFIMNRGYTYNRDKGKCRCCGDYVGRGTVHIHHERPYLPISELNKVNNLATVCKRCHSYIHNNLPLNGVFSQKIEKKILGFREKLVRKLQLS